MQKFVRNWYMVNECLDQMTEKIENKPLLVPLMLEEWCKLGWLVMSSIISWTSGLFCGMDTGIHGLTIHVTNYDDVLNEVTFNSSVHLMNEIGMEDDAIEYQRKAFLNFINELKTFLTTYGDENEI